MIELNSPVVRARRARRVGRSAGAARSACAPRAARCIGAGHPPGRRVRRRRPRRRRALRGDRPTAARAHPPHADRARCTSTSGCPTPRRRSASSTACASTCRCSRRWPRTRRSGTASTRASRQRARADVPRLPARRDPARVPRLRRLRADDRRDRRAPATSTDYTFLWWDVRPHPRLGHGRGPRDGRAVRARRGRRPRRARPRPRAARGARARGPADAARGAHGVELPRAPATACDATLWFDGALRPVPEVAARALDAPAARARPATADALEEVERILRDGQRRRPPARRARARRDAAPCSRLLGRRAPARPTRRRRSGRRICDPVVDRHRVGDRDAQAAVAGGYDGHGLVAVDRVAADEVAREVHLLGVVARLSGRSGSARGSSAWPARPSSSGRSARPLPRMSAITWRERSASTCLPWPREADAEAAAAAARAGA